MIKPLSKNSLGITQQTEYFERIIELLEEIAAK
jgi:hypothetical protein